ncbi:MAG: ATP-binding cassette domain-containing protein [Cytophagales bacterium]|nr:MAG: ATP-binding cassette domain-containing protein [Cytophagales bacterium]TAF60485.1 MAG: ATP-binding cassette domain-containing protein [Cytophagales bacterium]
MIEVQNVKKSFGDRTILAGVSGVFETGKCNMIIGASGTGKSVLLKCIVGLVKPDEGDILFDKRNFWNSQTNIQKEIRTEIGMLFQGGALFDSMTVAQNVQFPLDMQTKMSLSEKQDRVNFCLKRVGLEASAQKMPSEVSGGMKKRVGIARAIVMNSKYLFCDEPNSGLDPQTSTLIDNLIYDLTKEFNTTTVVVSHDMNSVMEIGENIMFLHQGYKVWEGNNHNIIESESAELQKFMFTNQLMRRYKQSIGLK